MKKFAVTVVLAFTLAPCQASDSDADRNLVLPSPKLLRCKSTDCFQLWPNRPAATALVFPNQTIIDMDEGCLYGMTAIYDKSISVKAVKAAIDESYGKWAYADFSSAPIMLWRVTPEKFAISLTVADKKDEKRNRAEAGSKLVTYIAFGGRSACGTP